MLLICEGFMAVSLPAARFRAGCRFGADGSANVAKSEGSSRKLELWKVRCYWRSPVRGALHSHLASCHSQILSNLAEPFRRNSKLTAASQHLQNHNAQLLREQPANSWLWQGIFVLAIFIIGGACGAMFEKNQTSDVLTNMSAQIERIQTPALPI
jgi:hypothetical protein